MATTNVASAALAAAIPHRASTAPPTERLPRSSVMLADLLRGAPNRRTESTSTPCPLFPTESEDYYCLSCHARCSGLALLVGPHTNHDYLPLKDALLYMPAALLRETQEVVRESEEAFAKPWRGQEQQREETLHYLMTQRRSKLAAIAQLMEDVRSVDAQLWRVTEAKAVDLGNWRYQQRALRRKMERLHGGADVLSASLRAAPSNSVVVQFDPSWLHRQAVAQEELVQVRHLLERQLEQLAEDEAAAAHHLTTWRRLLDAVPSGSDVDVGGASSATPTAATATATLVDSSSTWGREARRPTGATAGSDNNNSPHDATAALQRPPFPQPTPATPEPTTILAHPPDAPSPHPSDAEVVLLQHALLNIHDGLRRRLLRAAAVSLSSSSSSQSRLPSTSGEGATQGTAGVAETVASTLPPLPDETPLRDATGQLHRNAAAAEDVVSPPPRSSAHATAIDMVKSPVSTAACPPLTQRERDEDKEARSARWQSLQAQDRALKESLNQLLEDATGPALRHGHPAAAAASSSSASSFTPGMYAGEYATVSAVSGPLNSVPALQSYAIDY